MECLDSDELKLLACGLHFLFIYVWREAILQIPYMKCRYVLFMITYIISMCRFHGDLPDLANDLTFGFWSRLELRGK